MVRFNAYRKTYNDALVISADITLEPGVYWLQGENGSGKTTLLKSAAGLIPFAGEIQLNGLSLSAGRRRYLQQVSYAEAEPVYPAFLSGMDLVRFYIDARQGARKEQAQQVLELFGADKYADNKTGTYSSGMMKKLSLVLAFIGTPGLVLLDEPLITLDHEALTKLTNLIEELSAKGVTFIITSHQPLTFEDRSCILLGIKDKQVVNL